MARELSEAAERLQLTEAAAAKSASKYRTATQALDLAQQEVAALGSQVAELQQALQEELGAAAAAVAGAERMQLELEGLQVSLRGCTWTGVACCKLPLCCMLRLWRGKSAARACRPGKDLTNCIHSG